MAKKKPQQRKPAATKQDSHPTLADSLGGDTLDKLKEAKQALLRNEKEEEEKRLAQKAKERRDREKNMSFGELLEKYGDGPSKY
ncbi:Protein of unknown function [Bhargavaea ginsengi]|uniref:DUF3886 domain-containing protein n=1 Tax=Bhargavaea ginsengi TaxID=426757 RepID=A0A1H6SGF1_9BACL|nr:YqkE family protein [Bhargavaea ginsengi]SEI66961.1 Protein of unknown function [Bhargavaea ginsengi]